MTEAINALREAYNRCKEDTLRSIFGEADPTEVSEMVRLTGLKVEWRQPSYALGTLLEDLYVSDDCLGRLEGVLTPDGDGYTFTAKFTPSPKYTKRSS